MSDEAGKGTSPNLKGEDGESGITARPLAPESRPQSPVTPFSAGKGKRVMGYVLTALTVLFLLFDAAGKLVMPPQVAQAFVRLGVPAQLSMDIGILLLVCTALYAIPRTGVLGAILLTGYLGGAVAIQMRAGGPVFETLFPVIFAVIAWAGILLREDRLREVFPVRCRRCGK